MSLGKRLGRLATKSFIRGKDIRPVLVESEIPALTYSGVNSVLPLPRNYRGGCLTVRENAQDIRIEVGQVRATGDNGNIAVTSVITKQIDNDWAAGDDAGGFPDTALDLTASTWYHVFLLGKTTNDAFDAGFDTSITATNLLGDAAVVTAGYTTYRRVASVLMDSGPTNILVYIQNGAHFYWGVSQLTTIDDPGTSAVLSVITGAPIDHETLISLTSFSVDGTALKGIVTSPSAGDQDPDTNLAPLATYVQGSGINEHQTIWIKTDTSGRIRHRWDPSPDSLDFSCQGWIDDLGAFD